MGHKLVIHHEGPSSAEGPWQTTRKSPEKCGELLYLTEAFAISKQDFSFE